MLAQAPLLEQRASVVHALLRDRPVRAHAYLGKLVLQVRG
jgi:hypothetical protein